MNGMHIEVGIEKIYTGTGVRRNAQRDQAFAISLRDRVSDYLTQDGFTHVNIAIALVKADTIDNTVGIRLSHNGFLFPTHMDVIYRLTRQAVTDYRREISRPTK